MERFLRDLTRDVVREGSFGSVPERVAAMEQYLARRNLTPRPYRWKATGQEILAKLHRARQKAAAAPSEQLLGEHHTSLVSNKSFTL